VYLTQISLAKEHLVINNKTLNLVPGMTASAEIKLRKRRLIGFFISPLLKHTSESMREQ
jgi:hemolysin D